jgi:Uncharacterized conserved protein (COG2071)
MNLRTTARDCLYVNWAIPVAQLPDLPAPLRYELHRGPAGENVAFVSVLLFRFVGLRARRLPVLRLSYPQATFRLYVLDGHNLPAVLYWQVLVPPWVVPLSRFLGRQPAHAGRFDYPPLGVAADEPLRWRVGRNVDLTLEARLSTPSVGQSPNLGSWQRTVDTFRRRSKLYVVWDGRLRNLARSQSPAAVVPMAVEVEDSALMTEIFPSVAAELWQTPHSAWLCPEIPFTFELGEKIRLPVPAPRLAVADPV